MPNVPVDRLTGYARKRLWDTQDRTKQFPTFSLYLDAEDRKRRFHIPLEKSTTEAVDLGAPLRQPYLRISCSNTLLIYLLLGHVSWNIADAALFLDYERVPNVYDPEIYVLLNFLRV